jgi:hypothetical protein
MKSYLNFKKMFFLGVFTIAILLVTVTRLLAEEEKPTGDFTTAVFNQYIWRGYESTRNSIVIQPAMTIGYKGFSVNFWGNLDTKAYAAGSKDYTGIGNETDLTLSYSKTLGRVTVGGGYIYYSLTSLNKDAADRPDAQELFGTISLNTPLAPTLTVYKEIDHYRNWYFLLGISHAIELNKMVSLKLAASAGYLLSTDAGTYPKFDSNALPTTDKFSNFHDGSVSASLPIKVSSLITITPTASYIFPLSGEAKDEMKGMGLQGATAPAERDSSFFVGGVSASLTF